MAIYCWTIWACFLVLFSYTACRPIEEPACFIHQKHVTEWPGKYFNCTITNGQAVSEIVWKINGTTIKESRGPMTWLGVDIPHKTLSGILRCEAKAGRYDVACEIPLTGFPRITTRVSIYDTYTGHQLVVPCKATGNPQPTLTWTKRNKSLQKATMPKSVKLQRSRDSLDMVIEKASKMHSGIYMCEAVNHLGVDIHVAVVTVHYDTVRLPPRVVAVQPKITVQRGNTAVLMCTTEHTTRTLSALYWDHGDKRVRDTGRVKQKEKYSYEIVDGKYKIEGATMSLIIKQTSSNDAGMYTCGAVTHIGRGQARVQLIVIE